MSQTFENQNMEGTVFHRVNLCGARFEDVNLESATIRNANLRGLSIADAGIRGMTVAGFRVDELISAELDRRDPQRALLRMDAPHDPRSVGLVMDRLDALRGAFVACLRSAPPEHLRKRPGENRWSALEHVRHLAFAEDLYLNRWILRSSVPWTRLGLLPAFLADKPEYADVGREPCEDIEQVLPAWDRIHAGTRAFIAEVTPQGLCQDTRDVDFGQGTVGDVLQGMAHHDLHHIRMAEAAISAARQQDAPTG